MAEIVEKMDQLSVSGWSADKIRSTFIDFFVKKGHFYWPSSPVVPVNDPTLLFANAGMNQFKPLFLGTCDPSLEMAKLKMAVNSQKCIRAGGKHNDLEDVGKDVYHHTYFEMLGNWSFGAYFKEDAIAWAWECLTVDYRIDPARLYATYFGGDEAQGLSPDEEARQFWLRFLPAERIIPCGSKDNFWEMGATGPCGPCSEIHYDRIGNRDAAAFVNADLPDVIEIWNIVFIQFNRETDGSLRELPSKHVDTGMGFERLSSILQGKTSNYDTDIFTPIFDEIQKFAGCRAYQGLVGKDDKDLTDMAYRVVADHIRTLTFAVTDGAVPSNDGRGYVLRRILRRAVRYGQEILHAPSGFFSKLVDVVVANFSSSFPELAIKKEYVRTILMEEEDSFNRTLDLGVKHFKKVVVGMESSGVKVVPAKDAHILFSSMGFPLDLTELMAAELGYTVDSKGFEELMENDRKISEAAEMARKGDSSKDLTLVAEQTSWLQEKNILPTDSSMKYTWNIAPTVTISAIFGGRGNNNDAGFLTNASSSDGSIGLIFDLTSFYYESGGQIFDTGVVEGAGFRFNVTNCQTYAGYVVHVGQLTADSKSITVGDAAIMKVDYERRGFIAPNHTMTHVLNYALREVLIGKNSDNNLTVNLCEQKGSLVDAERLRFDFSWTSAMSPEQIAQVESIVNQQIKSELPVHAEVVPLSSAVEIKSLRKVFGERYPDPVRVLSVGQAVEKLLADPTNNDWSNYSVEFCGGTHLTNTNQAEEFVITEESGIAKGIRRISGLTRDLAKEARQRGAVLLSRLTAMESMEGGSELSNLHKSIKLEVDQAVVSLVDKDLMRKKLNKIFDIIRAHSKAILQKKASEATSIAEEIAQHSISSSKAFTVVQMDFGADGKVAKKIHEKLKSIDPSGSYFIASLDEENEKIGLFPMVSTKHIENGASAKAWVDFCIAAIGAGKGGGKADQANGSIPGGEDVLSIVLTKAEEFALSFSK